MRSIIFVALSLASVSAVAQNTAPAADPVTGSAALGYLSTSGNTESTNGNASFKLGWDRGGSWVHE